MKTTSKALAGTVAACAMAMSAASPALADHGRDFGFGGGWRGGDDNPHHAINRCSVAAEREASRYARGRVNVTEIRDVRETRYGYEVRGRLAVKYMGGWRDNGWNDGHGWNDRRGRDDRYGGNDRPWNRYDTGSFKCRVESGRIVDLDFNGIDRL